MYKKQGLIGVLFLLINFFFISCEKEINVNFPPGDDVLVVEGYIENGQFPIVILTKGLPFLGTITPDNFETFVVNDAVVTINDGAKEDTLNAFNFEGGTVYSSLFIRGVVGKTYTLKIKWRNKEYSASTKILPPVPLDSVWTERIERPIVVQGKEDTTFVQLRCRINEPATPGNYYRALTKRNSDFLFDTPFGSVYDDLIVNGKEFNFTVLRGKSGFQNNDSARFNVYGLFNLGDTIYVKWASIDQNQYDFWNTYESQGNSFGNPFSSTVIVKTNIKGENVTGIWASYGAFLDTIIAQ